MAESTLSLDIDDLKAQIGHFLGYGRGEDAGEPAWTTAQENNITDVLRSGLQQFYNPPPVGGMTPHSWSFLRPFATVSITSGTTSVALPDDFGAFTDQVYLTSPAVAQRRIPLNVTNEGRVREQLASLPDTTAAPRVCALSPVKGTTETEGTRYNLIFWPKADQNYTLSAAYTYLPDMLTDGLPYPPGGSEHAATIKAAVLAAAEMELDDMRGVRFQQFMERLAASVAIDQRKSGTNLGYNGDPGNRRGRVWRDGAWRHFDGPAVTYNGDPL